MRTREVTLTIPEYLYEESLKLTSAGLFRDLSELVSAGLRRELQAAKELLEPEETNWQEELYRLRAQIREKRAKYGLTAKDEEEPLDELCAARRGLWEYEIELGPGEELTLPASLIAQIGAGRWLITIQPLAAPIQSHSAFLSSYAPEDEGLYDDYSPR
jgi:Arc/MetJ-type ribon-helix-helix transcriptional regulator